MTQILTLILLFVILPWQATAKNFGDISIKPESVYSEEPSHGYIDYRFAIANRSPDRGHEVTLKFTSTHSIRQRDDIETICRTTFVGPKAELTVSLFQPCIDFRGDRIKVFIDGILQLNEIPFHASSIAHKSEFPLLFLERSFDPDAITDKFSINSDNTNKMLRLTESLYKMKEWPQNWLSYTRYDGVIIPAEEYKQAPSEVKDALLQYVEAGGDLLIIGNTDVPTPWSKATPMKIGNLRSYNVGLGKWHVFPNDDFNSISSEELKHLYSCWFGNAAVEMPQITIDKAVSDFQIPTLAVFSTKTAMMFFFIIFALAIGPVNLWILSSIKHKIWIFWTVPTISLLTSGLLFIYAFISEGWQTKLKSVTFSILDENSHRTTTLGYLGIYSPLTSSNVIKFSCATEITPAPSFYAQRYNDVVYGREITWGQDLQLGQGWLLARIPLYLKVRTCDTHLERLTIKSSGTDNLEVINGLGKPIKQLWLCDANRKIFYGENIKPGKLTKLSLSNKEGYSKGFERLGMLHTQDCFDMLDNGKFDWQMLSAGTYLAILDTAPFVEQSQLKKPGSIYEKAFIFGIMKEGEDR